MKLAGWFDAAVAVILGRTCAPGLPDLSQHDAALDALGDLGVPLVADVDCGHLPPHLALVNGALGTLSWSRTAASLTQALA
jgi:muramoyltetrapeptide carboxypeptidase LdcA involved in peptidoglycan recycling